VRQSLKNKQLIITVDGESSTGKTALSVYLAEALGLGFLNSGALYRSLAYLRIQDCVDIKTGLQVLRSAVEIKIEKLAPVAYLRGIDISHELMSSEVAAEASKIATDAHIRSALIPIQHSFVTSKGLVAEGRDMGSVIFPSANHKLYFTAPLEMRVERRFLQLKQLGAVVDKNQLLEQMQKRDERDRSREHSPLVVPGGAIMFDTSEGTLEENKKRLINLILSLEEDISS
jgi:cytidylate kinase